MGGLVLELQADALRTDLDLMTLIRKALVVSQKLNLVEVADWLQSELNGYPVGPDVPEYRIFRGTLRMRNPFRGWETVPIPDSKMADVICVRPVHQAVSEIDHMAKTLRGGDLMLPIQGGQLGLLHQLTDCNFEAAIFLNRASLTRVVDAVRTRILEWALSLEKQGILGEGMSFSHEEKQVASQITYSTVNNIGTMTHSQIQQHSSGSQSQLNAEHIKKLTAFLDSVQAAKSDLKVSKTVSSEIDAEIATAKAQLASPKPKTHIISDSLRSLKAILENAAGSVAGTVLLQQLAPLVALLASVAS
jgi:hypothetical protein